MDKMLNNRWTDVANVSSGQHAEQTNTLLGEHAEHADNAEHVEQWRLFFQAVTRNIWTCGSSAANEYSLELHLARICTCNVLVSAPNIKPV